MLRWPLQAVLLAAQSTPLILLMVFAGVIVSALGRATPGVALVAAVLVLGLFNGSNAGQAIAEARASLRAEGAPGALREALWRARAQVLAFVVNATRGSPAASVIGVPELLAAQTDIASFSSERVTTFTLLLVFYMLLVSGVVWAGNRLLARWEAVPAPQEARDA
jgi:ABC-type amino acid transport system permease subunit